ncbi:glycosyltransferase [Aquihabitans daechungensis]|uniref:glycosyltransferase n=1 Tax=Aquihabitans daechungensis TaxID=1052257 RepID=UPI003BA18842
MTAVETPVAEPAAAAQLDCSSGVAQIDITRPLPQLAGVGALGVRCLVRRGAEPLGFVDLVGPARVGPDALAAAIRTELGCSPGLDDAAPDAASEPAAVEPSITVVIATHDRPSLLDRCLTSLVASRPAPARIIVVDNAPSSDKTRLLVERWAATHAEVSYVLEPRPGLGRAHNAALPHVRTERVAFTDDDVQVDRHWVGALARAFEETPDTACVTGLIAPAELVTPEQWWVERSSGFAKGFTLRVRSLRTSEDEGLLFPYDAGTLGSGANMAFTTAHLARCGGFDADLGTGTRSLGGDDLAALHEVIASGHDLVYQPAAIVFHRHHADRPALRRQAAGYGAGLTAYLTSTVVHRPGAARDLARRVGPGLRQVFAASSPLNDRRPQDYPAGLVWRERAGMAAGPARYAWQRIAARRERTSEQVR